MCWYLCNWTQQWIIPLSQWIEHLQIYWKKTKRMRERRKIELWDNKSSTFRTKIQFIIFTPNIMILSFICIHKIHYNGKLQEMQPTSIIKWKYTYTNTIIHHINTWGSRKLPMKFQKKMKSHSSNPTNIDMHNPTSSSYSATSCPLYRV